MPGKVSLPVNKLDIRSCSEQRPETRVISPVSKRPKINVIYDTHVACSQRYNYLFVAYVSEIFVFQPQSATQALPAKGPLKFELPRSGHGREGYIDPQNPHGINHLIIGDIGNQETLLACCDDGDVSAISVSLIHQAVQRNTAIYHGSDSPPTEEVRAFFTGNVGDSAWGLAMHKEARLFAVSSNTHDIHIYAFALGGGLDDESSSDSGDEASDLDMETLIGNSDWNDLTGPPAAGQRTSQNLRIVLRGHETNIPNISFCNTGADPDGRYLVSTDIEDSNHVWDIWQQKSICDFTFTKNPNTRSNYSVGVSQRRGWGIACLNPSSFRCTENWNQLFGYRTAPVRRPSYGNEWDISSSVDRVQESSKYHPSMAEWYNVPGDPIIRQQEYRDMLRMLYAEWLDDDGYPSTEDENDEPASQSLMPIVGNEEWTDTLHPMYSTESSISTPTYDSNKPTNSYSVKPPSLDADMGSEHRVVELPFQILHTSEHDMCMFLNEGDTRILCNALVRQAFPERLQSFRYFDRLNMIHQIPELGIVVVGSAAGRAAILTLTTMKHTNPVLSGFRIDWIVPFKSQEDRGVRPEAPLMGIAVSPVQGQGDQGEIADEDGTRPNARRRLGTRRYRIMLVYAEHTILSYVIDRSTVGSGFEVNDRIVVL